MAKEGYPIIFSVLIVSFILSFSNVFIPDSYLFNGLSLLSWIVFAWVLWFFRDPERKGTNVLNSIISPADGKILEIKEIEEPYVVNAKTKVVVIFMNIFDCHINRIPISGKVIFYKYFEGEFLAAFDDKASIKNEQTVIGIKTEKATVVFKQIAGLIARRIICKVRENDDVTQGDRFGLIKFGSRVDIYLPIDTEIKVKPKQRVRAGESIIGILK